jgi:tellurite resistance protein TerC
MDNIFVIAMVFGFFAIPRKYQHRVRFGPGTWVTN